MPAKSERLTKINLVPQDEFEKSFLGKAIKWALTAGKSIVILTEFVVILAFLSRFKLDRDLNDLNEEIAGKQAVVESFAEVEKQMREIEATVKIVTAAEEESVGFGGIWSKLIAMTPRDTFYESVELAKDQIVLKGVSGSEGGFARLVQEVKKMEGYEKVSLGEIEFNQRKGGVIFTLIAQSSEAKK